MVVVYKVLGFEVVLTDEDVKFVSDTGEECLLSEELGWWERDKKKIWIWSEGLSGVERFGIFVHELVEWLLEGKLKISHSLAHRVANVVEWVVTFGRAKLYW